MDELGRRLQLEDRIRSCKECDQDAVKAALWDLYSLKGHPNPSVPVLFVKSPAEAISRTAQIYKQAMNKVEDGFMLRLQLPNAEPILVKSGVRYPTFLKWDFAAALFKTNAYVKADVWGYDRMTDVSNDIRNRLFQDMENMVRLHLEEWRRWSEAGEHKEVFRNTTSYWPISRSAAFGRRRRFPGSALIRSGVEPRDSSPGPGVAVDKLADLAFLVFPYDHFAVVIDFPQAVRVDNQGRLGNMGSPALEWRDGTGTWAVAGRMVPMSVATGRLTFKKIISQNNAEVKRVLIAHYGEEKFLKEIGAKVINVDERGTLYHAPAFEGERETFAMVAVTNSTPEPDGTYKTYYLRTSPNVATATEAVAMSFRMDRSGNALDWRLQNQMGRGEWQYNPSRES